MKQKYSDVNFEKLGRIVFNIAVSAPSLGHQRPSTTARDYTGTSNNSELEAQFVGDLFRMKTEEFCIKWFGSEYNAKQIKIAMMAPIPYKKVAA